MAERLTRAHRRKLEKETQQKIDLDNLSTLNVQKLDSTKKQAPSTVKISDVAKDTTTASQNEKHEDSSSLSSEEDSSEDETLSSEEDSSSEDEDEDLDELLNKAQAALNAQTSSIQLEKESEDDIPNIKISKMQTGISIDKELYLKTVSGRAKLTPDAVALVASGEKATKKASVVLTANKDNDDKKLNKKERQAEREKTTGKAWFDMPKAEMTDEIKRDLQVLKMRHILDRKRHYKKMGKRPDPKYFQIGTIIESPTEFFSARINTKDRKQTIVDELMANDDQKQYYKRKYNEVQERTNSGGKKQWKKLKAQRKALK